LRLILGAVFHKLSYVELRLQQIFSATEVMNKDAIFDYYNSSK
jgi:hypothetical protein